MLVYRVEHETLRCGPYNFVPLENKVGWGDPRVQAMSTSVFADVTTHGHPTPDRDGIQIDQENVCGFESIEQLYDWFSDESIHAMRDAGYVLHVYSVPRRSVRRGGHQVMFPSDSKIDHTIGLDTLARV